MVKALNCNNIELQCKTSEKLLTRNQAFDLITYDSNINTVKIITFDRYSITSSTIHQYETNNENR